MTGTICQAATYLGVELAAPDGSERASGHSLRTTGALGLAAAGVGTWVIGLHIYSLVGRLAHRFTILYQTKY
jgi:hypothetical protein